MDSPATSPRSDTSARSRTRSATTVVSIPASKSVAWAVSVTLCCGGDSAGQQTPWLA